MINRRIAMGVVSIMSAFAITGGATFALFDDSVTQTNNTFAVGDANLQIAPDVTGNPGAFGETIPGPSCANAVVAFSRSVKSSEESVGMSLARAWTCSAVGWGRSLTSTGLILTRTSAFAKAASTKVRSPVPSFFS